MSNLKDNLKRVLHTWEDRLDSVNKQLREGTYPMTDDQKLKERSKLYKSLIRELEYILITSKD